MQTDDPTIPDRLLLRALIEDGLPSKAEGESWPLRQPEDFARLVFDAVFGEPYQQQLAEPLFANIPGPKLMEALSLAQGLMGADGRSRLHALIVKSAERRAKNAH